MLNMWYCVFPFPDVQNYHGNLGFLSWDIIEKSLNFLCLSVGTLLPLRQQKDLLTIKFALGLLVKWHNLTETSPWYYQYRVGISIHCWDKTMYSGPIIPMGTPLLIRQHFNVQSAPRLFLQHFMVLVVCHSHLDQLSTLWNYTFFKQLIIVKEKFIPNSL